jgi:hypothetical protein
LRSAFSVFEWVAIREIRVRALRFTGDSPVKFSPDRKKVEKSIAMNSVFDIFLALRRP